MKALTESELKESFGVRVKLPVELINYRAIEVSVRGIEVEIKNEISGNRREKLLKIRSQLKRILNEL